MTVTAEQTLPAALDAMYAAVAGLVDPRKEWHAGQTFVAPSMYDWLVAEVPRGKGRTQEYTSRVPSSAPTVWVDAVDLQHRIDSRVRSWQPEGNSTPHRLRALASTRWRPQDSGLVFDYAAEVRAFTASITALLEPEHVKMVQAECPSCGQRWHHRVKDGERIRQPALQIVAEAGCTCQCCGAFWSPGQYLWLCRLLGFELPEGVLD